MRGTSQAPGQYRDQYVSSTTCTHAGMMWFRLIWSWIRGVGGRAIISTAAMAQASR